MGGLIRACSSAVGGLVAALKSCLEACTLVRIRKGINVNRGGRERSMPDPS